MTKPIIDSNHYIIEKWGIYCNELKQFIEVYPRGITKKYAQSEADKLNNCKYKMHNYTYGLKKIYSINKK